MLKDIVPVVDERDLVQVGAAASAITRFHLVDLLTMLTLCTKAVNGRGIPLISEVFLMIPDLEERTIWAVL
jgi:hypothetical protein